MLKWEQRLLSGAKQSQSVPHLAPGPSTHAVCLLLGTSALRTCEQPLQCEIAHQLGHDPVRYDLTGWLHKAKPNLAALDAPQVLQHSSR